MNKIQSFKFYLLEVKAINWGAALILVAGLAFVFGATFSVPTGEVSFPKGEVLGIGITHSSKMELSYPLAQVKLQNGSVADVVVPRHVVLSVGQQISVKREPTSLGGVSYTFHEVLDAQ